MTCPHCAQSLQRRDRSGRVCDSCKKEFAFEPKEDPLRLTDVRFRKAAERLGAGGGKFTAAQLRFVLGLRAGPPGGFFTAGYWIAAVFIALAVAGFVVVGRVPLESFDRNAAETAAAAFLGVGVIVFITRILRQGTVMTDETFQSETLERWRGVHGDLPKGLGGRGCLAGPPAEARPLDRLAGVVVCPDRRVLDCLLANDVPRDLRLGVLPTAAPADEWEKGLLALLRGNSSLPVLLLHDASAEGVFLARDLPRLLGLDAGHRIYDLGLNPRKSVAKNRKAVRLPVPAEILSRLNREPVGVDVAGSRPIRRGRARVTPEEMAWLMAGNCAPILAVPPASLVKRLKFALGKIAPKKSTCQEVEALESVGFMS